MTTKDEIAAIRTALAAHKREIESLAVENQAVQHVLLTLVDGLRNAGLSDQMATALAVAEINARVTVNENPTSLLASLVHSRVTEMRGAIFPNWESGPSRVLQ